ncbi:MAG TPA: sugar transferase [Ilumatobacter sp.]|nr:sugar transferase [Ilumatobacter sp.]
MTPAARRSKRLLDLSLLVLTAPLTVPVAACCALAVKLDSPGPVVFNQRRTGKDGVPFKMFKFRTMVVDAEAMKESLQYLNVLTPPDFKIPDDPRVTRVGRLLRATSLDELPQLWNVLRGDMSLVGPRPTSFTPDTWQLWHTRRLEVRPGLTGLWQVSGRHLVEFDSRSRLDDVYIRNASVLFDLSIMLRTVPALVRKEGA